MNNPLHEGARSALARARDWRLMAGEPSSWSKRAAFKAKCRREWHKAMADARIYLRLARPLRLERAP